MSYKKNELINIIIELYKKKIEVKEIIDNKFEHGNENLLLKNIKNKYSMNFIQIEVNQK